MEQWNSVKTPPETKVSLSDSDINDVSMYYDALLLLP